MVDEKVVNGVTGGGALLFGMSMAELLPWAIGLVAAVIALIVNIIGYFNKRKESKLIDLQLRKEQLEIDQLEKERNA